MSQFYQYTWAPTGNNVIALSQNVVIVAPATIGTVLLNGQYGSAIGANIIANGSVRNIAITSTTPGVQFTIIGTQNGAQITELITSINGTVPSVNVFDNIISITTNLAANGVSVDIGLNGFMPLISLNAGTNKGAPNIGDTSFAIAYINSSGQNVTWTTYYSLAENTYNNQTYTTLIGDTGTFFQQGNDNPGNSIVSQFNGIVWQNVIINVTGTEATTAFTVQFLQV